MSKCIYRISNVCSLNKSISNYILFREKIDKAQGIITNYLHHVVSSPQLPQQSSLKYASMFCKGM